MSRFYIQHCNCFSLYRKLSHQCVIFVSKESIRDEVSENMKNSLMSVAGKILLRKRTLIETINDELKNIARIEPSGHRSFDNFIANSLSAIATYCFFEKNAIDVCFVNDGQLTMF